jgi:hypothetical protein
MKSTVLISAFLLLSLGAVAQTCSTFPCVVARGAGPPFCGTF